jgi:hypothetical protein
MVMTTPIKVKLGGYLNKDDNIVYIAEVDDGKFKKVVHFIPDDAIALEEKVIDDQLILTFHYLTFKVVLIADRDGNIISANVIDRELCVCDDK